ncbi:cation-transporting P-type ATPase [Streptomyces lavendulocolor]|uniref:cation-transporting P-type ATPase n=1 Tax=Streptomyces lavendulocolor TaxID=67316 RepID=UPI003C2CD359
MPDERLQGLAEDQAVRLLAARGPNVVTAQRPVPLRARVLAQLRDPLIMVLLGAVVLTVVIGDYADSAVIALVVLVNTTVGLVQEVRADHAVAALSAMSAPTARVRRGGADKEAPSADIVPADARCRPSSAPSRKGGGSTTTSGASCCTGWPGEPPRSWSCCWARCSACPCRCAPGRSSGSTC